MAEIAKLIPRLKYNVKPRHRNLKHFDGPLGRINKMRKSLSALFKYERIELLQPRCDEVRGYAERLITEAIRHGDQHPPTVDMANFWLEDKQMMHKLFKVLAPRYKEYQKSFTDMHIIPDKSHKAVEGHRIFMTQCVLELRGNPYPPMPSRPKPNTGSLTNILLKEANKEFRKMKIKSESSEK